MPNTPLEAADTCANPTQNTDELTHTHTRWQRLVGLGLFIYFLNNLRHFRERVFIYLFFIFIFDRANTYIYIYTNLCTYLAIYSCRGTLKYASVCCVADQLVSLKVFAVLTRIFKGKILICLQYL